LVLPRYTPTCSDGGMRYKVTWRQSRHSLQLRGRVGRWRVLTCCWWRNEAPVLIKSGAWSDKAETEVQRRDKTRGRETGKDGVCVQVFHHSCCFTYRVCILYRCTGWRPVKEEMEKEDGKELKKDQKKLLLLLRRLPSRSVDGDWAPYAHGVRWPSNERSQGWHLGGSRQLAQSFLSRLSASCYRRTARSLRRN
jgi:hypothetical protein